MVEKWRAGNSAVLKPREETVNDRRKLRKFQITVLVLFQIMLMLGYVRAFDNGARTREAIKLIASAYYEIAQYGSGVPPEELVYAGIDGMMSTLDPHTHFLNPSIFKYMREEQEGSFFGIGISFDVRDGVLTVISTIEGTPAERAGIRAGDRILAIEGESAAGISTTEVLQKLRGEKGSRVNISVAGPFSDETREIELIRDLIPLKSVPYALMVSPETGYIRITTFATTTAEELAEAMHSLEKQGMERLILDLRNNSGGLLNAAIDVSCAFFQEDLNVVFTKGRTQGTNVDYRCQDAGRWTKLPVIVAVNMGSASASEIVAGAIQDHRRGLVIGDTTFGKGLVESLYPLDEGCALQITTAQYFTASGRFIQKPYDIPHRHSQAEPRAVNGDLAIPSEDGGIVPDVIIEDPELPETLLVLSQTFFDFALRFNTDHPDAPTPSVTDQALFDEFLVFLDEKDIPYDVTDEDLTLLRERIMQSLVSNIVTVREGSDAAYRVQLQFQPLIQTALALFDDLPQMTGKQ